MATHGYMMNLTGVHGKRLGQHVAPAIANKEYGAAVQRDHQKEKQRESVKPGRRSSGHGSATHAQDGDDEPQCFYILSSTQDVDEESEAAAVDLAVQVFMTEPDEPSPEPEPGEPEPEPEPETEPERGVEEEAQAVVPYGARLAPLLGMATPSSSEPQGDAWSNCEIALTSCVARDRLIFGSGVFRLPRHW